MQHRAWLVMALLASLLLAGCGFKLRGQHQFAFDTIAVTPERGSSVATELSRRLGDRVRPVAPKAGEQPPQVILDVLQEQREKIVVAVNTSGQVREFQLRLTLRFRLRSSRGEELIPESDLVQQRDISFNESAVLAKEAEEGMLYRDMQSDTVQQLLRRLAALKSVTPAPEPVTP